MADVTDLPPSRTVGPAMTYGRDVVPLGPFAHEPLDLWTLITRGTGGCWQPAEDMRAASAAWLLGALHAAGVDVGDYDRASAHLLFEDCGIPEMQVITGWIARGRPRGHRRPPSPSAHRASAARLLDALDHAGVLLGNFDAALPGYLIEDCGTPTLRAITGWIGRLGETTQPLTPPHGDG